MKLGITGFPLHSTRSPKLHRGFLRKARLKGDYEVLPFDPARGKAAFFRFLEGLREAGYAGINITIPHKEWAYEYARKRGGVTRDNPGRCAALVGAANTLVLKGRAPRAANTDASGLWDDIAAWLGARGRLRRVVILGTGGAARGALAGILAGHPATRGLREVVVLGRDARKARALESLLPRRLRAKKKSGARDEGLKLVLWCVAPVGGRAARGWWVRAGGDRRCFLYNLNYGDRAAETRGLVARARYREGLGMLKRQAIISFQIWRRAK